MDVKSYLKRIGYSGEAKPNLKTLKQLMKQHLLSIPFENLDVHIGRKIHLNEKFIFNKIIKRKRGGFCYELNGLFAWLLENLGFEIMRLSAQVVLDGPGKDFDHLTIAVKLGDWKLVDVGFGDSFRKPLEIKTDKIQNDGFTDFLIREDKDYLALFKKSENNEWIKQTRFKLEDHRLEEFKTECNYTQTSPDSWFTQKRLVTLAKPNGRITLTDIKFTETKNGKKTEFEITDEVFDQLLEFKFNIHL